MAGAPSISPAAEVSMGSDLQLLQCSRWGALGDTHDIFFELRFYFFKRKITF